MKLNPTSTTALKIADITPQTVLTLDPTNDDFQPDQALEFSIGETQNLYIVLTDLNEDIDIYLSQQIGQNKDGLKIVFPYANSTEYGLKDDGVFAQLPEGTYYVVIRSNRKNSLRQPFSLQNTEGTLIFNSEIFTGEQALLPNDPLLSRQWYLFNTGFYALNNNFKIKEAFGINNVNGILPNADIFAPEAWKIKHNASDIVVAVIDGGIDISHPDLKGNIWRNPKEIAGNFSDDDGNKKDDDISGWNFSNNSNDPSPSNPKAAHGTHVAGTIGAVGNNGLGITGISWDVQLMPLSIEDPDNPSLVLNPTDALNYAISNGADIANMSFGQSMKINPAEAMPYMTAKGKLIKGTPAELTSIMASSINTFKKANAADMLMVIAAGNEGSRTSSLIKFEQAGSIDSTFNANTFFSYFFDNAITVSSSDGMKQLSPYTNTGITVDLSAPGGNTTSGSEYGILSTMPLGRTELEYQELKQKAADLGHDVDDVDSWPRELQNEWQSISTNYLQEGDADYGYMQGTSMAAPVVSGAAALVKAVNPSFSAGDIRQILMKSAIRNPRLKGLAGQNGLQLDLDNALQLAQEWKGKKSFYDLDQGSNKDDRLSATPSNTWIEGLGGDDVIRGNKGDDLLKGGKGDDLLLPGEGLDKIIGGPGQDIIRYFHEDESPIARPDQINLKKNDQLDLSALDGNPKKPGSQKLKLTKESDFTGRTGELLARRNGIFADLDGDAFADFGVLFQQQLDFDITKQHLIL